jgi:GTP-dependent phosphoenolpyruvate carboxykinase
MQQLITAAHPAAPTSTKDAQEATRLARGQRDRRVSNDIGWLRGHRDTRNCTARA